MRQDKIKKEKDKRMGKKKENEQLRTSFSSLILDISISDVKP